MHSDTNSGRLKIAYSSKIYVLFILVLSIIIASVLEIVAGKFIGKTRSVGRDILMGRENVQLVRMQNTIGQPYLLYISAPNYSNSENGMQHNEDGYRGKAIPLDRRPGVLRVLCLGGSTTYGGSVALPSHAYPAVLEKIIRTNLPPAYVDVEVINAGLTWGTSAELLTHYHFKFHYYRPDIVVINTGGNDAEGYTLPYYHPDNSNWRQPMVNLRPLPRHWRWLAKSKLMSMVILNVFYQDQLYGGQFVVARGRKPDAPWFKPGGKLVDQPREIAEKNLSFLHNIDTLIRLLLTDETQIVLMPFRAAPNSYNNKQFELSQILRHEQILRRLAETNRLAFAPFPSSVITPENWTDHCHLNAAGEIEKATHVAPYVISLINSI